MQQSILAVNRASNALPSHAATPFITDVTAFVDWNSQLLIVSEDLKRDPVQLAGLAFQQATRRVARCLSKVSSSLRFRVTVRLYHGWHKGYEPSANRKALSLALASIDFTTLSRQSNVLFSSEVGYGDRLTNALDRRMHSRLCIHLPNTLRSRHKNSFEEKMVDTALVADVVEAAHREPDRWIVVMTEDDDLVPCVFTAEAVLSASQSKVILLRKSERSGMLALEDLLFKG